MRLGMVSPLYFGHGEDTRQPEALGRVLAKAKEKRLDVVSGGVGDWRNPERIGQVRRWLDDTGVELEVGFAYNYCEVDPDVHACKQAEFADFVRMACVPLGVRIVGTCAVGVHRWTPEPPLAEQIERTAAALKALARIAGESGVRIAIENHADYRGPELVSILRAADEPNLGARLDTANPFWVFEEPVDAARALAPYTITTHVKDLAVAPFAQWKGVPLGQGHVDLPAIVAELAAHAPDPAALPLVMEVECLPEGTDLEAAADDSLEYLRSAFAAHLG
jgi:sugar phosphate isomerase/epimerase